MLALEETILTLPEASATTRYGTCAKEQEGERFKHTSAARLGAAELVPDGWVRWTPPPAMGRLSLLGS